MAAVSAETLDAIAQNVSAETRQRGPARFAA
jgi:hypothetical protein